MVNIMINPLSVFEDYLKMKSGITWKGVLLYPIITPFLLIIIGWFYLNYGIYLLNNKLFHKRKNRK